MITLQDSLQNNSLKSLDNKYLKNGLAPYSSTTDVNTTILSAYRSKGLTVLVSDGSGFFVEYWYKDGIGDTDLELKTISYSGTDGITIGADNIARLGGPFSQDAVIDLADFSLTLNNQSGVASSNFFKIGPGSIESRYIGGSILDVSSFKVDSTGLYFNRTNSVGGGSSTVNSTANYSSLSTVDAAGNQVLITADSSSGIVGTLRYTNSDSSVTKEVLANATTLRIGTYGSDAVFQGISFTDQGEINIDSTLVVDEDDSTTILVIDSQNKVKGRLSSSLNKPIPVYNLQENIDPADVLYIRNAGIQLLGTSLDGTPREYNPHFAFSRMSMIDMSWAGAYTPYGMSAPTATGTESFPSPANTDFISQTRRALYTSSASAGFACGVRGANASLWRGTGANMGGFFFSMKFGIPTSSTDGIVFAGLRANTAAIGGTTVISSLVNIIGICKEAADTTLNVIRNDGSGTGVKEDTAIAISSTSVYRLIIFCKPSDTKMFVSLENLETGESRIFLYDNTIDADLPANDVFLSYHLSNANNTTASAVSCSFSGATINTNN